MASASLFKQTNTVTTPLQSIKIAKQKTNKFSEKLKHFRLNNTNVPNHHTTTKLNILFLKKIFLYINMLADDMIKQIDLGWEFLTVI